MTTSLWIFTCLTAMAHILTGQSPVNGQTNNDLKDCSGPFDIVILLDSSVSLRDSDPYDRPLQTWKMMTTFASSFVEKLPSDKNINVAAVRYSSQAEVVQSLMSRESFSGTALNALTFLGQNTNTAAALSRAKDILTSSTSSSRKIVVLMTDGLTTLNIDSTLDTAQQLKSIAEVYSLGVSYYIDHSGLAKIASSPESKYLLRLRGEGELDNIRDLLLRRVCNLPETTVPPIPECTTIPNCEVCVVDSRRCEKCEPGYYREGWNCQQCPEHCINCTSEVNCADCDLGYYKDSVTGKCLECTKGVFDLSILIDSSGSIRDKNIKDNEGNEIDNFLIILNFAQQITDGLPISENQTRVSVISFSNTAQIYFYLNSFYDRATIRRGVGTTPFEGGFTNITGAMRLMRTGVFIPQKGDRPDVLNVCILITDGKSTKEEADAVPEAGRVKGTGTKILAVGVTNEIDEGELRQIVSQPVDDHFFYSPDILTVKENVLQRLRNTLCNSS